MSDKTLSEQARELIHVTKRNDWPPGTLGKILPMLRALADENDRLRADAERLDEYRALAKRCLSLDREPQQPKGGMQTGDMIVVGMRDWFQLLRLARWIDRDAARKGDGDE